MRKENKKSKKEKRERKRSDGSGGCAPSAGGAELGFVYMAPCVRFLFGTPRRRQHTHKYVYVYSSIVYDTPITIPIHLSKSSMQSIQHLIQTRSEDAAIHTAQKSKQSK